MDVFSATKHSGPSSSRLFEEIQIGDSATSERTLTQKDIELLSVTCGSMDASHAWGANLVSALIASELPGPGAVVRSQSLQFEAPIKVGDRLTVVVLVADRHAADQSVTLHFSCTNQAEATVITGTSTVSVAASRVTGVPSEPPEVHLGTHQRFHDLLVRAARVKPLAVAVTHPCDSVSLGAAVEVAQLGLVIPILVGPQQKIQAIAHEAHLDISAFRIVDAAHSHDAAAKAVALVRAGEAALLMKGSLHTDEFMHAVVSSESGLRTERRLSHVYIMDVPSYPRPLFITDAVVNIAPTLEEKVSIVQNAIDLALALGLHLPRVAILCAVETVNCAMRATLDAAALSKMADRGQITGGLVDGPLALDNAVSPQAARQKGIVSTVAGVADILVVPDLEAGNMLAKQLSFLAGADAAGVVLGARVPIVLTSRADSARTRIASCAVAVLMAHASAGSGPAQKPLAATAP